MTDRPGILTAGALLTTVGGLALLDAASATVPQVAGAVVAGLGLAGVARRVIGTAGEDDRRSRPRKPP